MIFLLVIHLMWLCSMHVFVAVALTTVLQSAILVDAPATESYELLAFVVEDLAV